MKILRENNFKYPVFNWCPNIETNTLEQISNLAQLPFVFRHIAIMPDAHYGYGMPIGGVMATEDVVIPNAVGVDIGCGMCAIKTSLTDIDTNTLKKIMGEIRKVIPIGFNKHKEPQDENLMPLVNDLSREATNWHIQVQQQIINKEYDNALKSVGTLGGGNHFIEIQKGSDRHIWIMIHSGSRNLGLKVATHYNKLAIALNEKWHSQVPKEWELAFLPIDSEEGQSYIREMNYCVEFALANRKLMMERICKIFYETDMCRNGCCEPPTARLSIKFEQMINIAHNYASQENHYNSNVWVHRKGATQAKKGQIGIIPGSQGTTSYIVKGLGNRDSFESCSHGAGRVMGRKQAIKTLDLQTEIDILDKAGVIHGMRNQNELDESVSCYKDIKDVMKNQQDLVEILVELKPLAVIKA